MQQNLWAGAGYDLIAVPLAAGVLAPIGFVLPMEVGALLMSLSTVVVAFNARCCGGCTCARRPATTGVVASLRKGVGVAARGWTALLLLAAVFALHGLQCTAAATEHTAGHGAAAVAASPAGLPGGGSHSGATSPGLEAHTSVHDTVEMVAAAPLAGLLAAGHASAPAGAGGHLWTLCLAVLAAGLAALLALLLPHLLTLLPAAWAPPRAHAPAGLALLRPPDLHALCLLRI